MESRLEKGLQFSRRVLPLRAIGCTLSAILVFATIYRLGSGPFTFLCWAINGLIWPVSAYAFALRATDPITAERRNLLFDALFGGAWVAVMRFADAPSAVLVSMLIMHNAAVGGMRLMVQGGAAIALGAIAIVALTGFNISLATDVRQVAACFPMLLFYPAAVGLSSYKLARQLSQSKKAIREMSGQDDLTGLKNRYLWMKSFTESFQSNQQSGDSSACVAIVDIDEFKRVNDTYGHLRGDALLRVLGVILRKYQSASVSAGRYGGDEFCILFDKQGLSSTLQILEEIRGEFLREACRAADAASVTLSIGVAEFCPQFETHADWLAAADSALYVAKRSGRNSVTAWGAAPEERTAVCE